MIAFWAFGPCSILGLFRRFGGTYWLHLHSEISLGVGWSD